MVDASVVLAWQFRDESNPYADSTVERLEEEDAIAPAVWPLEVANAFVVGVRRGRLSSTEAAEAVSMILDLPVTIRPADSKPALQTILDLAATFELSAYDASYIHLAQTERLPLATLDGRLREIAERAGVAVL